MHLNAGMLCCESTVMKQKRARMKGFPFVLFEYKNAKQESLGLSPAELVFGHNSDKFGPSVERTIYL